MRARATAALLALLLLAGPAAAQQADTVPVPWPVAVGGVTYIVLVDGATVSSHSTLYGALRVAGRSQLQCRSCDVTVTHAQTYRIDIAWAVTERDPIEEPDPDEPPPTDPDPDPDPEPDPTDPEPAVPEETSLHPTQVSIVAGQSVDIHAVAWWDGAPHLCAVMDGQRGWREVVLEPINLWRWADDPAWRPAECPPPLEWWSEDPDIATVEAVERVYPVAPPDTLETPLGSVPQPRFSWTADDDPVVSWDPVEGATSYRVWWARAGIHVGAPVVRIDDLRPGDWLCVRPWFGSMVGSTYRCSTWSG